MRSSGCRRGERQFASASLGGGRGVFLRAKGGKIGVVFTTSYSGMPAKFHLIKGSLYGTLTIYLSICLSNYLSVYLPIFVSICLSIFLFIFLSVHLFICLSICLSIFLSFFPAIPINLVFLCMYFFAIYLSISLSCLGFS